MENDRLSDGECQKWMMMMITIIGYYLQIFSGCVFSFNFHLIESNGGVFLIPCDRNGTISNGTCTMHLRVCTAINRKMGRGIGRDGASNCHRGTSTCIVCVCVWLFVLAHTFYRIKWKLNVDI